MKTHVNGFLVISNITKTFTMRVRYLYNTLIFKVSKT